MCHESTRTLHDITIVITTICALVTAIFPIEKHSEDTNKNPRLDREITSSELAHIPTLLSTSSLVLPEAICLSTIRSPKRTKCQFSTSFVDVDDRCISRPQFLCSAPSLALSTQIHHYPSRSKTLLRSINTLHDESTSTTVLLH